jgi:hypothetical protein
VGSRSKSSEIFSSTLRRVCSHFWMNYEPLAAELDESEIKSRDGYHDLRNGFEQNGLG